MDPLDRDVRNSRTLVPLLLRNLRQTSNEMISTVEARAPQLRASNGSEP